MSLARLSYESLLEYKIRVFEAYLCHAIDGDEFRRLTRENNAEEDEEWRQEEEEDNMFVIVHLLFLE